MYRRSAEIYDLLYTGIGLKNFATEAAELNQIIRSECPGARTLLDIGCGTGALLAEMQRWYDVAGVDLSPAMLAVARRRLPEVLLIEADMRTFGLGRTFDAVLCLFSSIGYMTEDGDMERAEEFSWSMAGCDPTHGWTVIMPNRRSPPTKTLQWSALPSAGATAQSRHLICTTWCALAMGSSTFRSSIDCD